MPIQRTLSASISRAAVAGLAAAAALLTALAMLATAAPAANAKTVYFKAKIQGTQTNVWTANYGGSDKCDPPFSGKGREVIRFRSAGWVPIKVVMFPSARYGAFGKGDLMTSFYARRGTDYPAFKLRGHVTRSGNLSGGVSPPECAVADGDGTWTPPKRDCGRKPIRKRHLMAKVDPTTGWLSLENIRTAYPSFGDFKNCKVFGWAWPTFLVHDDRHKWAGVDVDAKRTLNNRKLKNLIFIGRGKSRHTMKGVRGHTRIEWSMTLRRMGR